MRKRHCHFAVLIYNPSFRTFTLLHLNGVPMDLKLFVHFFLRFFLILSHILTFQSQLNVTNQFKKLSYNTHCSYINTTKASNICHLLHDIILDLSATCISLTTLPAVICSFPAPKTCQTTLAFFVLLCQSRNLIQLYMAKRSVCSSAVRGYFILLPHTLCWL